MRHTKDCLQIPDKFASPTGFLYSNPRAVKMVCVVLKLQFANLIRPEFEVEMRDLTGLTSPKCVCKEEAS